MFLHLGENTVISSSEIIGIFDMDNTTVSKATRDYLSKMQKDKKIIDVSLEFRRCGCRGKSSAAEQVGTLEFKAGDGE